MSYPSRFLTVAALLAALVVPAAQAQMPDVAGVYFDPDYTIDSAVNADVPHLATAYIVLKNPTQTAGGLGGWECRVELEGYEPLIQWHVNGYALNFKTPPDFVVAMTQALPITGPDVLLASFDMYIAEPLPFAIELVPLRHAPSVPDAMSYIPFDDKEQLTPMTTVTGTDAVASYNWVPYCELDRNSIGFTQQVVGETALDGVVITNRGGGVLHIDATVTGDPDFQLTSPTTSFTLSHDQSRTVQVSYRPRNVGTHEAILDLGTSCGSIPLTGSGREAVTSYLVQPTRLDMGDVPIGPECSRYVTFINTGDVDFEVSPALAGCSDFNMIAGPRTVRAGQSFPIRVEFTRLAAGRDSCTLLLGPGLPDVPLIANAVPASEVLVAAADSLVFPDLLPGASLRQEIRVVNTSGADIYVYFDTGSSSSFYLPSSSWPRSLDPGQGVDVPVYFGPDNVGEHADMLIIRGTDFAIPLTGTCVPPTGYVQVNPEAVNFYSVAVNGWSYRAVEVTNYSGSPILVDPLLEPVQNEFHIDRNTGPSELAYGESRTIMIAFTPREVVDYYSSLVLGPGLPVVPIAGSGRPPYASGVSVEPEILEFGTWPVGSDAELEARVINRGQNTLSMDVYLDPAGAPFVLSAGGSWGVLPPGSTAIIRVRFQPTTTGTFATSVNLTEWGGFGPIQVRGSAQVEAPVCVLSTTELAFPPTATGGGRSLDITVSNAGTGPLDLRPAVDCDVFTCLATPEVLQPGETGVVTVIFSPEEVDEFACGLVVGDGCGRVELTGSSFIGSPGGNTDLVGVYFDGGYTQPWIFDVGDGDDFEAYLVLQNVTGADDITGFECRVLDTEEVLLHDVALTGAGYNFSALPELTVGFSTPHPVADQILLATLSYTAIGVPDNEPIALVPKRTPSIADAMALISGPEHVLRPMYPGSGQPVVAWVNYWDRSVGNDDPVEEPELPSAPRATRLLPNVPNPFNPETSIRYEVAKEGRVRIDVYDVMGRRVTTLLDEVRGVGADQVRWQGRDDNGRTLPSGAYYVRLETMGRVDTRKVMLLK